MNGFGIAVSARTGPYFVFAGAVFLGPSLGLDHPWNLYLGYGLAAALLLGFRRRYTELALCGGGTPASVWLWGVVAGLVGAFVWIAPYHFLPRLHETDAVFGMLGEAREGFDLNRFEPVYASVGHALGRSMGYVLVTPLFEELFIRSFLIRYLVETDFETVPMGTYTRFSFWGTALFFSLTHPEWIVALFFAVLLNGLLILTKRLEACVIAHAVANLILILYVLLTGNSRLW